MPGASRRARFEIDHRPARSPSTLSWGASTDAGGSGLAGYHIYGSNSSGGPFGIAAKTTATSYADVGLRRNRSYWYYVKAYDGAGNRSLHLQYSKRPRRLTPPTPRPA